MVLEWVNVLSDLLLNHKDAKQVCAKPGVIAIQKGTCEDYVLIVSGRIRSDRNYASKNIAKVGGFE
jgi:hypothetical protein